MSSPKEWRGDVWIKDNWTDEEKSHALHRLRPKTTANGEPSGSTGQGAAANHSTHELDKQRQALNQFHRNASTNWNVFYDQNQSKFFKDRHYLHKAFPLEFGWLYSDSDGVLEHVDREIPTGTDETDAANSLPTRQQSYNHWKDNEVVSIVEIGCGVGNAILPLLEQHSRSMELQTQPQELPQLQIHCLDFAPNAVHILKEDKRFQSAAREGRATAHVYDLSSMHPSTISIKNQHSTVPQSLANSADVAILLFCLSAIGPHPSSDLTRAARHVMDMLKPGGILVIRDYGRLDEAQFKLGAGNKELGENFYRKGDGTGCYYFELNDLRDLFSNEICDESHMDKLDVLELEYIQRVYRNRGDGTTRRRVWVQGRFQKPLEKSKSSSDNIQCRSDSIRLQEFFKNSIQSWDNFYKMQVYSTSSLHDAISAKFPNNLLQIFPSEFQHWQSLLNTSHNTRRKNDAAKCQLTQTDTPDTSTECPLLSSAAEFSIIEIGCGFGNETLLNIVAMQQIQATNSIPKEDSSRTCPRLKVHFVDASMVAIGHLRNDPRFKCAAGYSTEELNATAHSSCATTQVLDITTSPFFPSEKMVSPADMALLLFTLSSIGQRSRMRSAIENVSSMLKSGGVVLLRDFGRFDDDQLQLNSCFGSQIFENFYYVDELNPMGRGTAVYFFDLEEVRELFVTAGFQVMQLKYIHRVYSKSGKNAKNLCVNGGAVRRTRVWVHGIFRKL